MKFQYEFKVALRDSWKVASAIERGANVQKLGAEEVTLDGDVWPLGLQTDYTTHSQCSS